MATVIQERLDELAKGLATNQLSRGQVFKGFFAGALLATPLGALWEKRASAQEALCVSPECTDRALQAYASCKRECRNLNTRRGRRKCLRKCKKAFEGKLLNCGCLTLNENTTTGQSTPAPCADPCTTQTLYEQANQDFYYSKLADYLASQGFVATGNPKTVVLKRNGSVVQSLLSGDYSHPERPNQRAILSYEVKATGETAALATVWDKMRDKLLYLLAVVDDQGQVEEVRPVRTATPTSKVSTEAIHATPSGFVSAAAGAACNSEKLFQCRQDKASDALLDLAPCALPCAAGGHANPLCVSCIGYAAVRYANRLRQCSEQFGCGLNNLLFCKDNVCCGVTETGCNGVCCASDEICEGGLCKKQCPPCAPFREECCQGQCLSACRTGLVRDPETCACVCPVECPPGQTPNPDSIPPCVCMCDSPDLSPCGEICVDLLSDKNHCGQCDIQCDEECEDGHCTCSDPSDPLKRVPACGGVYGTRCCDSNFCEECVESTGTCRNLVAICSAEGFGTCCGTQVVRCYDPETTICLSTGYTTCKQECRCPDGRCLCC